MAEILACGYSLVHLLFLFIFYAVWRWDEIAEIRTPEVPKHEFCLKWTLVVMGFLAVDLFIILPVAIRRGAIVGVVPWLLIKIALLILLFLQKPPKGQPPEDEPPGD